MTVTDALSVGEAKISHGCSTEEEDHLIRSTKKIKSIDGIEDATMVENQLVGSENLGVMAHPVAPDVSMNEKGFSEVASSEKVQSFKQALLRSRFNENRNEKNFDCDVEEVSSDEDEPEMAQESTDHDEAMDDVNRGIPRVKISQALLKKIREPWKKCLIVRLLGKKIGYKLFMAKMTRLWGLQADFEALDIGHGFFIVKFDMIEDYTKVYTGGPWIVMDHYVTVRKWQQDFRSDVAEEDTTAFWVRFLNLPIEYYNEKVLFHIAKVLGVPLKIDINTAMASRGKYARVCIEMDLRKPLVSQFAIGKNIYLVEYEHLHSVCFSCGRVGHVKEVCPDTLVLEQNQAAATAHRRGRPDERNSRG
ncbi:hypothetical protein ACSBR2_012023 [Camellia fascicularis]